jgi:hypothetical protein
VDHLGEGVNPFREFGFLIAEPFVVGFKIDYSRLEMLERLRDSVDLVALFLEFRA